MRKPKIHIRRPKEFKRPKKVNQLIDWLNDHSPLSRLDRYIIAKFLGTYFFSIALIISIAVVFDINEHIDKYLSKNAPAKEIIMFYVNFIPYYANLFSQLFVFISVIFFTTKLAENSEIIAMMSTGVSFKRLMRPYMISAAVICVLTFVMGAYIIPRGNVERVKFENTYRRRYAVTFTSNVQLEVDTGVIAYLSRYEDNVKTGYDFRLDKFVNKKMISSLQAAMIQYDTLSEEPNHWIIKNYTERDLKGMREVITSGGRIDSIINMQPQDLLIQKGQQQTLTNPQLAQYIERQKQRGFANIQAFEVEYYQRGASSFAAFILTAIGLSLSAKKRKNGMGISLGIGLLLSFAYIMFQTISATFAIQANFPPMLAVWIPNIVFMFIAVYCYKFAPK
ncbi:MAG: LptF/LptG family permease [Bacteroidaceae bacterium]|nr:LptF/LptG family permease [Bacteroidaceae bacterium]MCR4835745.1 LptF/LptG family permease [Bacteroidaceae bacterium]